MNRAETSQALIGFGQVRHTRLKPVRNAFTYGTYFLMLPMRSLAVAGPGALVRNRWAPLSFFDVDHGDGRSPAQGGALAWLDDLLQQQGIDGADGEVWLHCYPRVLGHTFKPVSFWYCHRADGTLRAIVAEGGETKIAQALQPLKDGFARDAEPFLEEPGLIEAVEWNFSPIDLMK